LCLRPRLPRCLVLSCLYWCFHTSTLNYLIVSCYQLYTTDLSSCVVHLGGTRHFRPKTLRHWFGGNCRKDSSDLSAELSCSVDRNVTLWSVVRHPMYRSVSPYFWPIFTIQRCETTIYKVLRLYNYLCKSTL